MRGARPPVTLDVSVLGIGLLGPGLNGWAASRPLLAQPDRWMSAPTIVPPPLLLPPAERRRAGTIVKLGLTVAEEARAMAGIDAAGLATVFAASSGDPANCHAICEALATDERMISPTRFTNSVHNASAGYWHIAAQSRAPSISLCGHDATFGGGLLEAAVQCVTTEAPVLLIASDVPYLEPLHGVRPLPDAFGVALLLGVTGARWDVGDGGTPRPRLRIALDAGVGLPPSGVTPCDYSGLEALRRDIPSARALALLEALACATRAEVVVDYLDGLPLRVHVDGG